MKWLDRLSGLVWLVGLLMVVASYWLLYLNRETVSDVLDVFTPLSGLAFCTVGVLIVRARPGNRVGWLASSLGFALVLSFFCSEYAIHDALSSDLPYAVPVARLGQFVNQLFLVALAVLALMYPSGSIRGWVWRIAEGIAGLAAICFLISAPYMEVNSWRYVDVGLATITYLPLAPPLVEGPIPFLSLPAEELDSLAYGLVYMALLAGVVRMTLRYVRNRGVERIQIKWLVYVLLVGFGLLGTFFATGLPVVREAGGLILLVGSPVAIGVAITRHGLYEIDRVISRTVTYAIVAGVLVAVLAALATAIGVQFQEPWVVASTTLAVAAVFNPLRRRIQAWVDHRFNRSRYDAERVMDDFAGTLRDRVDPDGVVDGWVGVVVETMQPSSAGVWVRE